MSETHLDLGPGPPDQFLSPVEDKERCASVMNSSELSLTPHPCREPVWGRW